MKLSSAQRDIWAAHRLNPKPAHHLSRVVQIVGAIEAAALQEAVDAIVADTPTLRLAVVERLGQPVATVIEDARTTVSVGSVASATKQSAAIRDATRRTFDLQQPPQLRVSLLHVDHADRPTHLVVVVAHHLAVDGPGFNRLVSRIVSDWADRTTGVAPTRSVRPPPATTPTDAPLDAHYWVSEFEDLPDHSLPGRESRRPPGTLVHFRDVIGGDTDRLLRVWATRHGHTHASALLAVFGATLHRWLDATDVVLTTQATLPRGRDSAVSMATTTIPVRSRIGDEGAAGFADLTRQRLTTALRHRAEPLSEVLSLLRPERRRDGTSVFSDFEFNHMKAWRPPALDRVDWTVSDVPTPDPATQYALTLSVVDGGDHTALRWHADGQRLDDADVQTASQIFRALLTAFIVDTDARPVTSAQVLDEPAHAAQHTLGLGPARTVSTSSITELFLRQDGARIALRDSQQGDLSYRQLSNRAGGLQKALAREGIQAGDRVAVMLDRNANVIATQLAIWALNAVYVPIDRVNPDVRRLQMLELVRPAVLVTDERLAPEVASRLAALGVAVVSAEATDAKLTASPPPSVRHPAYIVFTSGSTGQPKGVEVGVAAMNNHLDMILGLGLGRDDCIAQNAPLGFDVHVWQCVGALTVGGSIRIVDDAEARDPTLLARAVAADGISVLEAVPSLLDVLASLMASGAIDAKQLVPLRHLLPTGEALPMVLAKRLLDLLPGIRLTNAYGPAEAADDVTLYEVRGHESMHTAPLGRAGQNVRLAVLDQWQRHRPADLIGEIAVIGVCVGNGYVGSDPKQAFRDDPCSDEPMYLTGDLGFIDTDGVLHYLGRGDQQVKIGGRRIEIGEIESALVEVEGVVGAAVVRATRHGHPALIGYLTSSFPLTEATVKQQLARRLPDYMVPSRLRFIDEFPTTTSGKLNRNFLVEQAQLAFDADVESNGRVAADETLASSIESVWRSVLGLDALLDRAASFFALGGDSFGALELIARLSERGVSVDMTTLYAHQSLNDFERAVAAPSALPTIAVPVANRTIPTAGRFPPSLVATAGIDDPPSVVAVRFDPWIVDEQTLARCLTVVSNYFPASRLALRRQADGELSYEKSSAPAAAPVIVVDRDDDDGLLAAAAAALRPSAAINLAAAVHHRADRRSDVVLAATHALFDISSLPQLVNALAAASAGGLDHPLADEQSAFLGWLFELSTTEATTTAPPADTTDRDTERGLLLPSVRLEFDLPGPVGLREFDSLMLAAAIKLARDPATSVGTVWREVDGRMTLDRRRGFIDPGCYTNTVPAAGISSGPTTWPTGPAEPGGVVVNTLHQSVRFPRTTLPSAHLVEAAAAHNAATSRHLVHIDGRLETFDVETEGRGPSVAHAIGVLVVSFHPQTSSTFRQRWVDGIDQHMRRALVAPVPAPRPVPDGTDLLNLTPSDVSTLLDELDEMPD